MIHLRGKGISVAFRSGMRGAKGMCAIIQYERVCESNHLLQFDLTVCLQWSFVGADSTDIQNENASLWSVEIFSADEKAAIVLSGQ